MELSSCCSAQRVPCESCPAHQVLVVSSFVVSSSRVLESRDGAHHGSRESHVFISSHRRKKIRKHQTLLAHSGPELVQANLAQSGIGLMWSGLKRSELGGGREQRVGGPKVGPRRVGGLIFRVLSPTAHNFALPFSLGAMALPNCTFGFSVSTKHFWPKWSRTCASPIGPKWHWPEASSSFGPKRHPQNPQTCKPNPQP